MDIPLKNLSLFSSGVGFFEHSGSLEESVSIVLPFKIEAVNDALKSLAVNDPASEFPMVTYSSAEAIQQTLKSLKVDLSGERSIQEILNSLKGDEIEIFAPSSISGRILGVEYRAGSQKNDEQKSQTPWLSIFTPQGITTVEIKDISSFAFKDEKTNADLGRALDIIMNARDADNVNLTLSLPGKGKRKVDLNYVIPMPVWKVTYRLDIGGEKPLLQGWAIVDNDSDTDWKDVKLSLITGKPVSFIQNLYSPYHTDRPEIPLAIAGFAEAKTYQSGTNIEEAEESAVPLRRSMVVEEEVPRLSYKHQEMLESPSISGGSVETAAAAAVGEQFEFTLKRPVSLTRRGSAMFPLVESPIEANKVLVLSGAEILWGPALHPALCVELVNTAGMSLPAGPITVYDGTYSGDALVEFFPENEKRLISYGEDLTVLGSGTCSTKTTITGAALSKGVMEITGKITDKTVYTVRNASALTKKLIIEHACSRQNLLEPAAYYEKTADIYRFRMDLPPYKEIQFTVKEEEPQGESVILAKTSMPAFLSWSSNQELPEDIRKTLHGAIALRKKADEAAAFLEVLQKQKAKLIEDQDRIRRNLEAAGNTSPQGQKYLKRMDSIDNEIDSLNEKIAAAEKESLEAENQFRSLVG
ncbi:MAG: hypothetical protein LBQ88_17010 [Treponema sp.]|jgi:hypothetical protein|nr:hypothetical protein [Treponema sp.]